jgi:hypothetical protein
MGETTTEAVTGQITEAGWRQECEVLKREMPDFWRHLYPHIYATPLKCGQYCSAKEPLNMFLSFLHNAGVDKGDFQDGPELSAH